MHGRFQNARLAMVSGGVSDIKCWGHISWGMKFGVRMRSRFVFLFVLCLVNREEPVMTYFWGFLVVVTCENATYVKKPIMST